MKKNDRRGGPVSKVVMAALVLASTAGFVSGLSRSVSADGDTPGWFYSRQFFSSTLPGQLIAAIENFSRPRPQPARFMPAPYSPSQLPEKSARAVVEPREIPAVESAPNTFGVNSNGTPTFDPNLLNVAVANSGSGNFSKSSGTIVSDATTAIDGETDWKNAGGTAWNTAGNWTAVTGSAPPAPGDVAWFTSAFSSGQPNLTTAISIAGLNFSTTTSSGYAITRTSPGAFTLTGFATSIGAETGDSSAVAIASQNTSGTNKISVAIALAPSSGTTSTFSQAAGGTLDLSSSIAVISGSGILLNLTGGGTISLGAVNTYSGGTTVAGPTIVNAGTGAILGTGTLELNSGKYESSGGTTRTLANVLSITGDFTFDSLSTGALVFTGGGSTTGNRILTVNTVNTSLTTSALTLGGNLTTTGTGSLTLSGGLNLGAVDRTITGGATGQTTISGAVDSSAASHKLVLAGNNVTVGTVTPGATNTVNFEVNATGAVLFSGASTYTGTTTLTTGELSFGSSTALSGGALSTGPVGKGTLHIGSGTNSAILSTNVADTTTRTVKNNVTLDGDVTFAPGSGQTTGRIALDTFTGLTTPGTFTLTRTNQLTVNTGETVDFIGAITGSTVGITKLGAGILNLGNGSATDPNANTYNGLTTVSGGIVNLRKASGVDAIAGDLQINSTGTVALGNNNQINNGSALTLNGGTLKLSNAITGFQEGNTASAGVGALTLNSSSVIDMAFTSLLHLSASNSQTWTGTLSIFNWSGTPTTGGGTEQLLFGVDNTALTQAQLDAISFYSDGGVTFLGTAGFAPINDGEIVPVPEPSTWIGGALALVAVGYMQRRRLRGLIARS